MDYKVISFYQIIGSKLLTKIYKSYKMVKLFKSH